MKNIHKISISAFVLIPALLSAQSILIDFSGDDSDLTGGNWNDAVNPGLDTTFSYEVFSNLVDSTGAGTGISLNITDGFHGRNRDGVDTGSDSGPYPDSAISDSWYTANTNWEPTAGDTLDNGFGILEFTGLDSTKTYDFTMFASRMSTTDNRETEYEFVGANNSTVYLDPGNNTSATVTASGLNPTAGGVITLKVQAGPNNNNSNAFAYLGVMEIAVIPEPATFALLLGAMATGLVMLRRRS